MSVKSISLGLLGEDSIVHDLSRLIEEKRYFIINVFGDHGSGKSTLLERINTYFGSQFPFTLLSGMDDFQVDDIDQKNILLIDDVDNRFSRDQFKEILFNLCAEDSETRLVFATKTRLFTETMPGIPVLSLEMGNRVFNYDDFLAFLQHPEHSPLEKGITFPEIIMKNTFLFVTYCRNFNYVHDVLQALSQISREKRTVTPQRFIEILTGSSLFTQLNRDLLIDTKQVEDNDYLFVIRPKDKIEKLRDLIIKYYPDEHVLYEVMLNQFNSSFVEEAFKQKIHYKDLVLNICMSYDPVELLIKLLGPRDIIIELSERRVGEASFSFSIEDKAKLILKNIGLNIMEEPKGIEFFSEMFGKNLKLLTEDRRESLNKEYIMGLGISCYQEMEHIFHELLHFYSTYFCSSMANFFTMYNETEQPKIVPFRITFGQYIRLFSYLNQISKEDRFQLKMLNLGFAEIIPSSVIRLIEEMSSMRSFFTHYQKIEANEVPVKTYLNKILKIVVLAEQIVTKLKELKIHPEIIKIKQIIFDEFGRTLYVANDWKRNEIRFSLSSSLSTVHIYTHYYLLRNNQAFSINPIIIPRYFEDDNTLFQYGAQYDKSSQTQQVQGTALIRYVRPKDHMKILDVGCGNGKTTIELYETYPDSVIEAFDISDSMIGRAEMNRDEAAISQEKLHFYVKDAVKLDEINKYDLVFSNATLHWITDSTTMYTKLLQALRPGGQMAVHQGGSDSYEGLHKVVRSAIEQLDLQAYYQNWAYPIYYPTKAEFENLLLSIGFSQVKVESVETSGKELPNLIENFVAAGMLPYLLRLPDDNLRKRLTNTYLTMCRTQKVDTFTHRLYATAYKEGGARWN